MHHVHKTEKFRYPISDVILERGKELAKTVFGTVSGKILFIIVIKSTAVSITNPRKADHVRLTCSKHTVTLASEGEFL